MSEGNKPLIGKRNAKQIDAGRGTYHLKFKRNAFNFNGGFPTSFSMTNQNGDVWHQRDLDGLTGKIKVNMVYPDLYDCSHPVEVEKIEPIAAKGIEIVLPEFERNKMKDFSIIFKPDLYHTPARIFTDFGRVEVGKEFFSFSIPIRTFILLHEIGHFFYKTEWKADLFALKYYLMLGFNESNAYYALSKVLKHTPSNQARIDHIFNAIFEQHKNNKNG